MPTVDDLTILLAIKDRRAFTLRWMSYADAIGLPFRVVVADGGSDAEVERVLSNPRNFPHVSYCYVRYPYDRTYTDYYAKLADALARIRTPFAALADDDDFVLPDGVRAALAWMRAHPTAVACGGQIADVWIESRRVEWRLRKVTQPPLGTSARARLRHYTPGHYEPFYYVHRTSVLREAVAAVRDAGLDDYYLGELLRFFLVLIAGDTAQLDTLYLARQADKRGTSTAAYEERFGDSLGRMLVPSWSTHFTRMIETAAAALARADGITIDEARPCIVAAYRMWAAPELLETSLHDLAASTSGPAAAGVVVRSLYNLPRPGAVRSGLQRFYRGLRRLGGRTLRRLGGIDADFEPIRDFLRNRREPGDRA